MPLFSLLILRVVSRPFTLGALTRKCLQPSEYWHLVSLILDTNGTNISTLTEMTNAPLKRCRTHGSAAVYICTFHYHSLDMVYIMI